MKRMLYHGKRMSHAIKNKDNKHFVYSATHDLRNPLINLNGFTVELDQNIKELRKLLDGLSMEDSQKDTIDALLNGEIPKYIKYLQSATVDLENLLRVMGIYKPEKKRLILAFKQ